MDLLQDNELYAGMKQLSAVYFLTSILLGQRLLPEIKYMIVKYMFYTTYDAFVLQIKLSAVIKQVY